MRDVYIITRCTDLDLKASATLVFDSIRVGFPTWNIYCYYLGDFEEVEIEVKKKCKKYNIILYELSLKKFNYEVISLLIDQSQNDFLVVDSDIVFWKNLEWYKPLKNLAGRHIPRYYESFVKGFSEERLHTSLLYFSNIPDLRKLIKESFDSKTDFTPYNVFKPVVVKNNGTTLFYDSCSILYNAIGGEAFGKDVLECYDHLFCGSFHKEVAKDKPEMDKFFNSVFADHRQLRGIHRSQNKYWYQNFYREIDATFKELLPEDAQIFIINYVDYIELIDDLVDKDEKILVDKITERSLKLFSCNYWHKNSQYLRLIEQITHIIYFNSVNWENSNIAWKRREAKAMSHFGYLMPLAIFLFETNNYELTSKLALQLQERSHLTHMEDLTQKEYVS